MGSKSSPRRGRKESVSRSRDRTLPRRSRSANAPAREALLDEAPAGAGSILKALRILEEVVATGRPASVAEISTLLNYSKPTTHRIASFLEEFGYLEREPDGRRLIESGRFIDLALQVLMAAAQRPDRRQILNWVVEQTGETCNFGVMNRGELVYLDRVESEWPLGLRFEPGSRVPIHCTAIGKLFLSALGEESLDALLKTTRLTKYTDATITDQDKLRKTLAGIRKAGVSIDNQEFMSGVVCIAVPVFDQAGRMRAGLAISAPEARMSAEHALEHAPVLRAAAAKMQAAMFSSVKDAGDGEPEEADDLLKIV